MAAKYEPVKLADPVRVACNQCLADLQGLMTDIDRADRAGTPSIDSMRQRCQTCLDRFAAIKTEYFPGKK